MKITKEELKNIIKEEVDKATISEQTTVDQKVKYLKKNKDLLESNFNIRVDNLILSWESKL